MAWRKGLRRTLDLPACTHSRFVDPVCRLLPLRDEFVRRCASFIFTCLSSDNTVVKAISRNGVYFMRMLSPFGRNAQQCCDSYGLSLHSIHASGVVPLRHLRHVPPPDSIATVVNTPCPGKTGHSRPIGITLTNLDTVS